MTVKNFCVRIKMTSFIKDKIKLVLVALLCAFAAWGFWYGLGMVGFYIIGAILLASYSKRLWDRIRNRRWH